MGFQVAAFYRFALFSQEELPLWQQRLRSLGEAAELKGTVLLAPEGVNGTICGPEAGVESLVEQLRLDPRLADLEVKTAEAHQQTFYRLKVRIKREIVTMGCGAVKPYLGEAPREASAVGTHVSAQQWNQLIADPETLVIDTRNDYEVALGSFAGAIDPGTGSFREFPAWVENKLKPLVAEQKPRQIAMFCTGGIRCEKATAYLLQQGFEGVHHLQGGILKYLETVPEPTSQWQGECFVFDQRVTVNHQLEPGEASLCHACRRPLTAADRLLPSYVPGVSCGHCLAEHDAEDRGRFAERQRQIGLAKARGEAHIGKLHQ
ncbi:rhodanese-related sulfurtransferase [Cyanobium sp. WAJ14-Wanaka]|uniref:oxygen-dependent tRNA uridine(34) hydroxylase TrhO n=1 Tax=Cyanobium sp. WAJ14-Wanaka TaxID=2823725 RepID=UPI0020CDE337|nr:rhodanese-related sulfurtransferase [Cyanobium sp. WAJ14-Wanaka]MCP9774245.1 rhodanese-related sulfurtransferase [Cyanobium sp. WAJ14-Wanaka]